jgi:hypothetical protein
MIKRMFSFVLSAWTFTIAVVIITGCDSSLPTAEYSSTSSAAYKLARAKNPYQRLNSPGSSVSADFSSRYKSNAAPSGWRNPIYPERDWDAIIIHHSATHSGNASIFHRWHRDVNNWLGIGYNFVIGNGSDSGDGQIETTFRWTKQIQGAHCGGTPDNWANERGIGICLVGDFTDTRPTQSQMKSLANLVNYLERRYNIPKYRIYGHRQTPGYSGKTQCPGTYFNLTKLKNML